MVPTFKVLWFSCLVVKSASSRPQERTHKHQFEVASIAGVFAGYETVLAYGWSGIYRVWKPKYFVGVDLRQLSVAVGRRQVSPFLVRELVLTEECILYPLKAEYERLNSTLEGMRTEERDAMLKLPAKGGDAHVVARVMDCGDHWFETQCCWCRLHMVQILQLYVTALEINQQELSSLASQ